MHAKKQKQFWNIIDFRVFVKNSYGTINFRASSPEVPPDF